MRSTSGGVPSVLWLSLGSVLLLSLPAFCFGQGQAPPSASPQPQEEVSQPHALFVTPSPGPVPFTAPAPDAGLRPMPITLPVALQLGNARAIDIQAADARLRVASALLKQAEVNWLPSVTIGGITSAMTA